MQSNVTRLNGTREVDLPNTLPKWEFSPIFQTVCGLGTILTSVAVLICFLRKPALRTSFNTYLITLLTANLLYTLFESTLEVMENLYQHWTLGRRWCTFYLYGVWVWHAFVLMLHVSITANRIWPCSGRLATVCAMTAPWR